MAYLAYVLDEASRALLLSTQPMVHPDKVAHHVTVEYPVDSSTRSPNIEHNMTVVGYAANDKVECVVVQVDDRTTRPDGKTFHCTLSIDKSKGGKAMMSNDLLAMYGWRKLDKPFTIRGKLQVVQH